MEVSFSAKAQVLSAITCFPLNSCASPCSVRSIRREFLGCSHNLSPPGIRSRMKCKKQGLHVYSPRFVFRASLDPQSAILVVAVVTVSAFTLTYLNYRQRQNNFKEISCPVDLQRDTSIDHNKDLIKDMPEVGHDPEGKIAQGKYKKSSLICADASITKALESPASVASSISDYVFPVESEDTSLSSVKVFSELATVPHTFPKEMHEGNEAEGSSELLLLDSKIELPATPVLVSNVLSGESTLKQSSNEPNEGNEISSYKHIFGNAGREELYTFCEANRSVKKHSVRLNGVKTLSSHASLYKDNNFSSPMTSSRINEETVSTENLFITTDSKGKTPLRCLKEGSFSKAKDLTGDNEKRISHHNGRKNLFPSSYPNEKHANNDRYPAREFNTYNRFLREGRSIECIEVLEHMKIKGLLDMNNVYHSGFFRVCKSKKSVKEAFRFTKLIPNPTLSTFNMLMSVCASSQDSEGAFQVMQLVQEAGLKADCKLYTTLISTCAKCGKVDLMFKVFHEMVSGEVEPSVHTYGALIDGCAKAGQVAKAFGAYGIMMSKNVQPDRVVCNALITACGQSGAVDRAFDVLAEMRSETKPIDPDHVTVGALMKACTNAGKVDQAQEVYNMMHEYNIKGTPEVYTIAVNSCSHTGDWEFACRVYADMTRIGVIPDEMFISALIDVAGHACKLDAAFEILQEARSRGTHIGIISYSSLMGACSNAKNWQKALELYEDIKMMNLKPTVSMMNALITALCNAGQLQKAVEILYELKSVGLCPNTITYSVLLFESEKKDDIDTGLMLLSQAKTDNVAPNLVMCRCLIAMCLRRFEKACTLGEPLFSFNSGQVQLDCKWTSVALMAYREAIRAGVIPTMGELSQVLGCLRLPHDLSLRNRLIENLGVSTDASKGRQLCSLIDGFGEYDPRAFSLLEEAASFGIIPWVSFKDNPIVDVRTFPSHLAEVYLLTVLKGLKHRLAAGAKLPNITILLPVEKTQIQSPSVEKAINLAGRVSQAIAALLRRLGLPYQGNESYGKIRIHGVGLKRWFQPKLASPFSGKRAHFGSSLSRLGKGIIHQQRNIRTGNLSLE